MKTANRFLALVALVLACAASSSQALALERCEMNVLGEASWAQRIVSRFSGSVYEYAKGMSAPRKVRIFREITEDGSQGRIAVHFRKASDGTRSTASYQLLINENVKATSSQSLDLARIWIRTGTSMLTNLARMVDCPTQAPGFLTFERDFE